MITKDKVTEIFCIIDEFCKHFDAENAQKVLIRWKGNHGMVSRIQTALGMQ